MSNGNSPPPTIDKKWLLAGILFVGTLLYVIAVFWIGIGSIQHVAEINAAARAAESEPATGTEAQPIQDGEAQEAEQPQAEDEPAAAEPYPISDFIAQALLVIGGALATHLGAYLGISVTNPNRAIPLNKDALIAYFKNSENISGILAVTYFLALVLAIIFWAGTGFSVYAGKPLQDLAYSFLGIFAGAMAALTIS